MQITQDVTSHRIMSVHEIGDFEAYDNRKQLNLYLYVRKID